MYPLLFSPTVTQDDCEKLSNGQFKCWKSHRFYP